MERYIYRVFARCEPHTVALSARLREQRRELRAQNYTMSETLLAVPDDVCVVDLTSYIACICCNTYANTSFAKLTRRYMFLLAQIRSPNIST
jgi:hypothetical protein